MDNDSKEDELSIIYKQEFIDNNDFKMKKRSIFKIYENFKRYIFFSNNRTGDRNQKKEKARHPGVDLVRLVGMYTIVLNHFLFYGNAFLKFSKYKE
jgi:hypothetical protein